MITVEEFFGEEGLSFGRRIPSGVTRERGSTARESVIVGLGDLLQERTNVPEAFGSTWHENLVVPHGLSSCESAGASGISFEGFESEG